MTDSATLVAVAGIVVALGVAVLLFRLQRELRMGELGERTWVAYSDWLPIIASLVSLLFVVLPYLAGGLRQEGQLPAASCAAAVVLVAGYFPAILAHYRLVLGRGRTGPRDNPEPAERFLVRGVFLAAFLVFGVILFAG